MDSKTPKILVLNDLSLRGGRDIQRGIFEYLDQTGCDWDLRLIPTDEAHLVLKSEIPSAIDRCAGVILTVELDPSIMDWLAANAIPTVAVGIRHAKLEARTHSIAFIRNDNLSIGRLAAEHLLSLGKFNSYAFIPARGIPQSQYWSNERRAGFVRALQKANVKPLILPDGADIIPWLSALPKPAAILAAYDTLGAEISHACTEANIRIPQSVAILGVDNDDLICRQCHPALSSVLPGHHEMGYAAARELHRLMTRKSERAHPRIFVIPPKDIIVRDSTRLLPPAAILVRRMKDFIRFNATKGISVSDVVRHVRVSRRLAELRFQETEGLSLRKAIEARKLALAQHLLARGNRSVTAIARECGFTSGNQLTRVFKLRFGQSIRAWQKLRREA